MSGSSRLLSQRIEDANRVRGLYQALTANNPDMTEEEKVRRVTQEANKRTPAGGYMYLSSFKRSEPSSRWVVNALRGLIGAGIHIGPSLLTNRQQPSRRTGMASRMDRLERALKVIADGLGVDISEALGHDSTA